MKSHSAAARKPAPIASPSQDGDDRIRKGHNGLIELLLDGVVVVLSSAAQETALEAAEHQDLERRLLSAPGPGPAAGAQWRPWAGSRRWSAAIWIEKMPLPSSYNRTEDAAGAMPPGTGRRQACGKRDRRSSVSQKTPRLPYTAAGAARAIAPAFSARPAPASPLRRRQDNFFPRRRGQGDLRDRRVNRRRRRCTQRPARRISSDAGRQLTPRICAQTFPCSSHRSISSLTTAVHRLTARRVPHPGHHLSGARRHDAQRFQRKGQSRLRWNVPNDRRSTPRTPAGRRPSSSDEGHSLPTCPPRSSAAGAAPRVDRNP